MPHLDTCDLRDDSRYIVTHTRLKIAGLTYFVRFFHFLIITNFTITFDFTTKTPNGVIAISALLLTQAHVMSSVPALQTFMGTWQSQGPTGQVREFDETGLDADCIKIRMLAIWEADDTMNSWVSERDHPSAFLA
jgi:hypothetical protein